MKVLVISQAFPYPPFDGNLLPIYHFLRCLAPRVEYTLLTHDPGDPRRWEEGRAIFESWGMKVERVAPPALGRPRQAWECLRSGRLWVNRFFSPGLARAAARLLQEDTWDLIHAEGILSAQHLPRLLPCGSVLIARDCLSLAHWRAWRHYHAPRELFQWLKIRRMERDLYRRAGRIMAISPTDQAEMRRISPRSSVELLPNGVDLENFRPLPHLEEPDTLVFSGAMDFPPNIDAVLFFAREVWPLIRQRHPQARLLIVGRDPDPTVQALGDDRAIVVTRRVASIQKYLAQAAVIVSPLRHGTGMKNKVLEGAAMGKAMVVSPTSLEDIDLKPERDLLLAETPESFAEQVVRLLQNPEERRRLGQAARRTVEQSYAWEVMAERLWACYQSLAGVRPAQRS